MERIWTKHKQINTTLQPKVFVGMSGGVDSSLTAAILKERKFDVRGVHIKMWSNPSIPCHFKEDRHDAYAVAEMLDIPFETWDFTDEYRMAVVDYLIREYAAGRTPNPDVMCNRHIKFGMFLKRALERGADYVATGHYVRLEPEFPISNFQFSNKKKKNNKNSIIENYKLKIAKDINKDQSYFLWTLTQEQLRHCLFPLGDYTKQKVREMARARGLATAEKKDSQGICFIGEIDIKKFLKTYIPTTKGQIINAAGNTVGEHDGLAFYTIGQREGLGIGGGIPYYVAHKEIASNTLVVALGPFDEALFSDEAAISDVHWIAGVAPRLPLACEARIRYRQPFQRCRIEAWHNAGELWGDAENFAVVGGPSAHVRVRFPQPQRAVTPGQSIVFYAGEIMLGGGIIA